MLNAFYELNSVCNNFIATKRNNELQKIKADKYFLTMWCQNNELPCVIALCLFCGSEEEFVCI